MIDNGRTFWSSDVGETAQQRDSFVGFQRLSLCVGIEPQCHAVIDKGRERKGQSN